MLYAGRVDGLTLGAFEAATGLSLCDTDGTLKEDLPPITQFLNRVLALRIDMQNSIFGYLEERIEAEVEAAVAAGVFEVGVETLTAERFTVTARKTIFTHAESGAETRLLTVTQVQRVQPLRLADVMGIRADREGVFLINRQSGRAALAVQAPARMFDDGRVEDRVRLYRPMSRDTVSVGEQAASQWQPVEEPAFALAWQTEIDSLPETMESTISVVTGLLLPIWSRLPQDTTRVYRLQTDDGERIIGRMVAEADLGGVCRQFGLDAPAVSPVAGSAMVRDQGVTLQLARRRFGPPQPGHGRSAHRGDRHPALVPARHEGDGYDDRDHQLSDPSLHSFDRRRRRHPWRDWSLAIRWSRRSPARGPLEAFHEVHLNQGLDVQHPAACRRPSCRVG